jgi:hypothetical protein
VKGDGTFLHKDYENRNLCAKMQTLTEAVFQLAPPGGLFDTSVIRNLFPDSSDGARRLLVNRAVKRGEILRLKRGVFVLSAEYRKSEAHPFAVAAMLHFPSHISLESALSFHGLIPEVVHEISSVTLNRSCEFRTPLGDFTFTRVPVDFGPAGVETVRLDKGRWAFVASPLRALADRIYVERAVCWSVDGLAFLTESLRIEEEDLARIGFERYEEIHDSFRNRRVRRYLAGMRKALEG